MDLQQRQCAGINSTSSIQKTTGTYTNTDGDVLYVDASTGKFAPSGSYIQINNTTKMTVPVIGDKAVLTAVVYKGGTGTDISEVLDGTHLNLTGTGLLKAECISNVTAPEDANSRKVEIVCYLDGQEGELTLEVLTNTYFKSLPFPVKHWIRQSSKEVLQRQVPFLMEQPLLQPIRQRDFPIQEPLQMARMPLKFRLNQKK